MKRIIIALSVVVIVLALIVCLVPMRDEAYAVTVEYVEPATEYVALSHKVNDYVRTEVIEKRRQIGSCGCKTELVKVEFQVACIDVKNTDDVAGQFLVILTGLEVGKPFSQNVTISLNASEQKTVEYQAEVIDCWDFEVMPGWKEVEIGEFVTKQRQEIRYKKVTALDYLLHYK